MTPGIMLIAVAAINADQSVPYCPLNAYKPIGRVLYLSDDVTISGQKKDFHEFTNGVTRSTPKMVGITDKSVA